MPFFPKALHKIHHAPILTLTRRVLLTISLALLIFVLLEALFFGSASRAVSHSLRANEQNQETQETYQALQESHIAFLLYVQGYQPHRQAIMAPLAGHMAEGAASPLPERTASKGRELKESLSEYLSQTSPKLLRYRQENSINNLYFLVMKDLEEIIINQQLTIRENQGDVQRNILATTWLLFFILIIIITLILFNLFFSRTLSWRFGRLQAEINRQHLSPPPGEKTGAPAAASMTRISYSPEDEFQPLVHDFNGLIQTVQTQQSALREKNRQLEGGLREREALLHEIHHRVKNNLQIIISLLNLQGNALEDPRLRQALLDTQNRISSMAMVHQMLYQTNQFSRINLADYLGELLAVIQSRAAQEASRRPLRLSLEGASLEVSAHTALSLGMFVNELLQALTTSLPEGVDQLKVQLSLPEGGLALDFLPDEGKSRPAASALFSQTELSDLVLSLVRVLADQLGGRLAFAPDCTGLARLDVPREKL